MKVSIRHANLDDAPLLKKFLMDPKILRWFPMQGEAEVDDSVRIWMSYTKLKAGFVAENEGQPVGFANLYIQPFGKLRHQSLFSILVREDCRGKGVGTALLSHLMKEAKEEHGIEILHLEVYDGNPAQKLYAKLGFEVYGRHERFIKIGNEYIDKIFMQRTL